MADVPPPESPVAATVKARHSASTCRWAMPTLFLRAPFWFEPKTLRDARPCSARPDFNPTMRELRALGTTTDRGACGIPRPRPSRSAASDRCPDDGELVRRFPAATRNALSSDPAAGAVAHRLHIRSSAGPCDTCRPQAIPCVKCAQFLSSYPLLSCCWRRRWVRPSRSSPFKTSRFGSTSMIGSGWRTGRGPRPPVSSRA